MPGYGRMMYARFTSFSKLPVLPGCLSRAFRAPGVAAEILVDNMKQAVDRHDVTTGIPTSSKSGPLGAGAVLAVHPRRKDRCRYERGQPG